jgi:hypothetical protein
MLSGGLLLCFLGVVACGSDEPVSVPTVTVTATVTASPAATSVTTPGHSPTASAAKKRRSSVKKVGSSAAFKHFKVTVQRVEQARQVYAFWRRFA